MFSICSIMLLPTSNVVRLTCLFIRARHERIHEFHRGLTFLSKPSILVRPLCERYNSSRLTRFSRFSIFVILFDCMDRILSELNEERFCEETRSAPIPSLYIGKRRKQYTSSDLILFLPNQSSVRWTNLSRFSIAYRPPIRYSFRQA